MRSEEHVARLSQKSWLCYLAWHGVSKVCQHPLKAEEKMMSANNNASYLSWQQRMA
jgi:hypothetical protein